MILSYRIDRSDMTKSEFGFGAEWKRKHWLQASDGIKRPKRSKCNVHFIITSNTVPFLGLVLGFENYFHYHRNSDTSFLRLLVDEDPAVVVFLLVSKHVDVQQRLLCAQAIACTRWTSAEKFIISSGGGRCYFFKSWYCYIVTSVEESFVFSPVVPCVDNTQEPISSLHLFQNLLSKTFVS